MKRCSFRGIHISLRRRPATVTPCAPMRSLPAPIQWKLFVGWLRGAVGSSSVNRTWNSGSSGAASTLAEARPSGCWVVVLLISGQSRGGIRVARGTNTVPAPKSFPEPSGGRKPPGVEFAGQSTLQTGSRVVNFLVVRTKLVFTERTAGICRMCADKNRSYASMLPATMRTR